MCNDRDPGYNAHASVSLVQVARVTKGLILGIPVPNVAKKYQIEEF